MRTVKLTKSIFDGLRNSTHTSSNEEYVITGKVTEIQEPLHTSNMTFLSILNTLDGDRDIRFTLHSDLFPEDITMDLLISRGELDYPTICFGASIKGGSIIKAVCAYTGGDVFTIKHIQSVAGDFITPKEEFTPESVASETLNERILREYSVPFADSILNPERTEVVKYRIEGTIVDITYEPDSSNVAEYIIVRFTNDVNAVITMKLPANPTEVIDTNTFTLFRDKTGIGKYICADCNHIAYNMYEVMYISYVYSPAEDAENLTSAIDAAINPAIAEAAKRSHAIAHASTYIKTSDREKAKMTSANYTKLENVKNAGEGGEDPHAKETEDKLEGPSPEEKTKKLIEISQETKKEGLDLFLDEAQTIINNVIDKGGSAGKISDGYHTFNELYHHRAMLFAALCMTSFSSHAWKSLLHHDPNEPMYDGMFIVGVNTPNGQATYHYDIDPYWNLFKVTELERAPEFDGHTPEEAIQRIYNFAKTLITPTIKASSIPGTGFAKTPTHGNATEIYPKD